MYTRYVTNVYICSIQKRNIMYLTLKTVRAIAIIGTTLLLTLFACMVMFGDLTLFNN